MKRTLTLMLAAGLLLSVALPVGAVEPTPASTLALQYDDHMDCSGKTVEIVDAGTPTSTQVGNSDALDTAVVTLVDGTLIATGIGTAQVSIDGETRTVNVTPATISLFMITGHSMGRGQEGNADLSVVGEAGQVYSSYGPSNLSEDTDGVGISYAAQKKANNVDAFTASGAGNLGEGSALAYQWNKLTGEKVWVLNTAVGGSCLPEWTANPPKDTNHYVNAVAQYQRAQKILKNEIDAGHYTLGEMGIIYHCGANFSYRGYSTNDQQQLLEWYQSMWDGFKRDFTTEIGGEERTVSFLGLVPIWIKSAGLTYERDEPVALSLAASAEYPDIFLASTIGSQWLSDESVAQNFPTPEYQIHKGTITKPTTVSDVFAKDNVHYQQVAYNAQGFNIADNLYRYLNGSNAVTELKISTPSDFTAIEEPMTLSYRQNQEVRLILHSSPITANDLTFEASGCIAISSEIPLTVTATSKGTGTLTVSQNGKVLKTLSFVCTDGPEHRHSYSSAVVAPTCTEQGYTVYTCSTCGHVYKDRYVDATGHTEVIDAGFAPSCTHTGYTAGKHCSVCHLITEGWEVIPKTAHTYTGGICACGAMEPDYVCDGGADCLSKVFTDVPATAWYHNAIHFAVGNKLFNGTSSTTFEPDSLMTRAMLVTVLWRYVGQPLVGQVTHTFEDVPDGQYYTKAVAWAERSGLVTGTSATTFEPDAYVTREQLATILYRFCKETSVDTNVRGDLSKFADCEEVDGWATDALAWAVGAGLIKGESRNGVDYLDPLGNTTRAQVATVFMRMAKLINEANGLD